MKVIINGMAALERKTGIGHYIDRVHRELTDTRVVNATLFPGDAVRPLAKRIAPTARQLSIELPKGQPTFRQRFGVMAKRASRAAAQAYFTTYSRIHEFDLYHEPNYLPFRSHLPTVITCHDLSVLLHPEWHPTDRVKLHETLFIPAAMRARQIITGSEQVRRELLKLIPVSPDRVTAVYYGIGDEFEPLNAYHLAETRNRLKLPAHFFLYVGAVEPRKNLMVALKAFVDLPASLRDACPLILAGPWAWKSGEVAEYFENVAAPAGARHLGYVSDHDRVGLYNTATALVYPSRYEGFGLPPVEMMACGGAVLAGSALAVREVLGRHATFIDCDDVSAWRQAMATIAKHPESAAAGRAHRIQHAKQYTWARCANETNAVYDRALNRASIIISAKSNQRAAA